MLIHVHHIYSALGCVIQDIEFMVGNMLSQEKVKFEQSMGRKTANLEQEMKKMNVKMPNVEELPSSLFKDGFGSFHQFKEPMVENKEVARG